MPRRFLLVFALVLLLAACAPGELPAPQSAAEGSPHAIADDAAPAPGEPADSSSPSREEASPSAGLEPVPGPIDYSPLPEPLYGEAIDLATLEPLPLQAYYGRMRDTRYERFWVACDPRSPGAVLFGFSDNFMMEGLSGVRLAWCWPETGLVQPLGYLPHLGFTGALRYPVRDGWVYFHAPRGIQCLQLDTGRERLIPLEGESNPHEVWGFSLCFLDDETAVLQRSLSARNIYESAVYRVDLPTGEARPILESHPEREGDGQAGSIHLLLAQQGQVYYLYYPSGGGHPFLRCCDGEGTLIWEQPLESLSWMRQCWGERVIRHGCYLLGSGLLVEEEGDLRPVALGQIEALGHWGDTAVMIRQEGSGNPELLLLDTLTRQLRILPLQMPPSWQLRDTRLLDGGLLLQRYDHKDWRSGEQLLFLPAARLLGGGAG